MQDGFSSSKDDLELLWKQAAREMLKCNCLVFPCPSCVVSVGFFGLVGFFLCRFLSLQQALHKIAQWFRDDFRREKKHVPVVTE